MKGFSQLNNDDGGGQYDSSGGAGGRGNPAGSVCSGYVQFSVAEMKLALTVPFNDRYAHYVQIIEPDVSRACIRCCQHTKDCPTNKDTAGCPAVIPGTY